jgi:hypothetical protein
MKNIRKFAYLFLILPIILISCQKNEVVDVTKSEQQDIKDSPLKNTIVYCGTPITATLVDFNETFIAGNATIGNDDSKLYVSLDLTGDWWIASAVLFAGPASIAGTIHPDGTGQFAPWEWQSPYRHNFFPMDYTKNHTFEVDLANLENCFIVVAFISAKNLVTNESKFIWGKSMQKLSGYYIEYCKQSCTPPPPPLGGCETGYAYGESYANCFLNIPGVNSNNWGWSNGPVGAGNYSWPIYAGAGQCNIGNGINVGTLTVSYTPPTATITYTVFQGYELNATHLYVGNQILPKKKNKFTTAPGQFPYKHGCLNGVSSDTFTINGLSGNIYIAAHSEVCDQ